MAALWALDALHWWAAHGAAGVNFLNTEWLRTDAFYRDAAGNYQVYPKAYGIRAFDLGSHGSVERVTLHNEQWLSLTAQGSCALTVPAASAGVVKLSAK